MFLWTFKIKVYSPILSLWLPLIISLKYKMFKINKVFTIFGIFRYCWESPDLSSCFILRIFILVLPEPKLFLDQFYISIAYHNLTFKFVKLRKLMLNTNQSINQSVKLRMVKGYFIVGIVISSTNIYLLIL